VNNLGIGFLCKGEKYVERALKNVEFWSKYFKVYIYTDLPSRFISEDCTIIENHEEFSFYDKLLMLDEILNHHETAVSLDADMFPMRNPDDVLLSLRDVPTGLHSYDRFPNTWKELKELEYFSIWKDTIEIEDEMRFPCERITVITNGTQWKETLKRTLEYKQISLKTEIEARKKGLPDENPHHGPARCESIAYTVACRETGFPFYQTSPYAKPFFDTLYNTT
jgi:hypothetical protein